MQIIAIDGFIARCEAKGVEREISLFLLQHEVLEPRDYVVVQAGYAVHKVTPQEARSTWKIYERILAD